MEGEALLAQGLGKVKEEAVALELGLAAWAGLTWVIDNGREKSGTEMDSGTEFRDTCLLRSFVFNPDYTSESPEGLKKKYQSLGPTPRDSASIKLLLG